MFTHARARGHTRIRKRERKRLHFNAKKGKIVCVRKHEAWLAMTKVSVRFPIAVRWIRAFLLCVRYSVNLAIRIAREGLTLRKLRLGFASNLSVSSFLQL